MIEIVRHDALLSAYTVVLSSPVYHIWNRHALLFSLVWEHASEKDLRICKNRQKMAGGFRNSVGRQMYCDILSFVETVKRRGLNVFQSIAALISGTPVLS